MNDQTSNPTATKTEPKPGMESVAAAAREIDARYGRRLFYPPNTEHETVVKAELERLLALDPNALGAVFTALTIIACSDPRGQIMTMMLRSIRIVHTIEAELHEDAREQSVQAQLLERMLAGATRN
jgi:hypothetical protein